MSNNSHSAFWKCLALAACLLAGGLALRGKPSASPAGAAPIVSSPAPAAIQAPAAPVRVSPAWTRLRASPPAGAQWSQLLVGKGDDFRIDNEDGVALVRGTISDEKDGALIVEFSIDGTLQEIELFVDKPVSLKVDRRMLEMLRPAVTPASAAQNLHGKSLLTAVLLPVRLPKIRVGVILSEYTASGPHWTSNAYGYGAQTRWIKEFSDPGIELYPIIEPGTEAIPALSKILAEQFAGKTFVNGHDAAELRKFNVIATNMGFNQTGEMSDALILAVKEGVGYLQQAGGSINPGYTPQINTLAGMADGEYGWNSHDVECEVIGTHPLLGTLSGKVGTRLTIRPNGHFGKLIGTPLIRVLATKDFYAPRGKKERTYDFYPLYISELGKGKIVGINFAHYVPIPEGLQQATQRMFMVNCVEWLAGRELSKPRTAAENLEF